MRAETEDSEINEYQSVYVLLYNSINAPQFFYSLFACVRPRDTQVGICCCLCSYRLTLRITASLFYCAGFESSHYPNVGVLMIEASSTQRFPILAYKPFHHVVEVPLSQSILCRNPG